MKFCPAGHGGSVYYVSLRCDQNLRARLPHRLFSPSRRQSAGEFFTQPEFDRKWKHKGSLDSSRRWKRDDPSCGPCKTIPGPTIEAFPLLRLIDNTGAEGWMVCGLNRSAWVILQEQGADETRFRVILGGGGVIIYSAPGQRQTAFGGTDEQTAHVEYGECRMCHFISE